MDTSETTKMNNLPAETTSGTVFKSRTISVQSMGEAQCPPSTLNFSLSVFSVKDSLEAAQASVKRRTDYIIQVLRNSGIKERSYKISTNISRSGECMRVQTDILMETESVSKCETVRNLLIEKLDASSVQFTRVTCCHHYPDTEEKRQEAFKRAVENARSKALSICQTVDVQLGPAVEVLELETTTVAPPETVGLDSDLPTNNLHIQYARETISFRTQVSVVFDTHPVHLCTNKKCKKHL